MAGLPTLARPALGAMHLSGYRPDVVLSYDRIGIGRVAPRPKVFGSMPCPFKLEKAHEKVHAIRDGPWRSVSAHGRPEVGGGAIGVRACRRRRREGASFTGK